MGRELDRYFKGPGSESLIKLDSVVTGGRGSSSLPLLSLPLAPGTLILTVLCRSQVTPTLEATNKELGFTEQPVTDVCMVKQTEPLLSEVSPSEVP